MSDKERGFADLKAGAARIKAGGPRKLVRPGEVYLVEDGHLVLPEQRDRKPHPTRHVIVLQGAVANDHAQHPTVLVAPCSASCPPGPFDIEFDDCPNGFTKNPTIYVSLVQPMLKSELGARQGKIDDTELQRLLAVLIESLLRDNIRI